MMITAAIFLPLTIFKVNNTYNSELDLNMSLGKYEFPNIKCNFTHANCVQFSTRKLMLTIIQMVHEGSINALLNLILTGCQCLNHSSAGKWSRDIILHPIIVIVLYSSWHALLCCGCCYFQLKWFFKAL